MHYCVKNRIYNYLLSRLLKCFYLAPASKIPFETAFRLHHRKQQAASPQPSASVSCRSVGAWTHCCYSKLCEEAWGRGPVVATASFVIPLSTGLFRNCLF